jgi:hypothetical protein
LTTCEVDVLANLPGWYRVLDRLWREAKEKTAKEEERTVYEGKLS